MIDEKKIYNYIKEQINPYGKPFTGTVYEFGLKIMDYIENMKKVGEWIPVSERLPEDGYGQTFLLTVKDGKETIVTFAKYQPKYRRFNLTGARSYWKPVAWMPLPEPYRPQGARKHFNADKIRAMSDEELAEFLMKDMPCDLDTTRCDVYCIDGTQNCKKCIMEWLQSEGEE